MRRVWYHGGDADGFGAAYALWAKYDSAPVYVPVEYGDKIPEYDAGDDIWIVDFSFPRADLVKISEEARLTVIDHHDSSEEDLEGLDFAYFDETKSAAVATWEHIHLDRPVPELLLYIQDRDLWQWQMPDSKAVSYALRVVEKDFMTWSFLTIENLAMDGRSMIRLVDSTARGIAKGAAEVELAGVRVLAVNSSCFASEIGHILAVRADSGIGGVWRYEATGPRFRWELRSTKDGPHVGEIAKALGGGGRAHTAGFLADSLPWVDPN